MVAKQSPTGLIATTRREKTSPLDDLVVCCGWPLLLDATPRRLQRELSLHDPECVLFWLDDRRGIKPTAQLIAWSRQRGARPYRVAVAFEMESDVESVFRAAGAHGFLPVAGQSVAFVADAIWPLLRQSTRGVAGALAPTAAAISVNEPTSPLEYTSDFVRPP